MTITLEAACNILPNQDIITIEKRTNASLLDTGMNMISSLLPDSWNSLKMNIDSDNQNLKPKNLLH